MKKFIKKLQIGLKREDANIVAQKQELKMKKNID
jgi:hypothetical protein